MMSSDSPPVEQLWSVEGKGLSFPQWLSLSYFMIDEIMIITNTGTHSNRDFIDSGQCDNEVR